MKKELIKLTTIRIDGKTQPRAALNEAVVAEYAVDCLYLPPMTIFHDGANYWLADGFHRYFAFRKAGITEVEADIRQGSQRDAILYSVGANATHGLRRTDEDKRRAVETLINDAEWGQWSNCEISRKCCVSEGLVRKVRASQLRTVRRYDDDQASKDCGQASQLATLPDPSNCPQAIDPNTHNYVRYVASPEPREDPPERRYKKRGKEFVMNTENIGRESPSSPPLPGPDDPDMPTLDELLDVNTELENVIVAKDKEIQALKDRLSVETMEADDEGKLDALGTIQELRERVRILEIELKAVKLSRDTYQNENGQLKRQCAMQRKEINKIKGGGTHAATS